MADINQSVLFPNVDTSSNGVNHITPHHLLLDHARLTLYLETVAIAIDFSSSICFSLSWKYLQQPFYPSSTIQTEAKNVFRIELVRALRTTGHYLSLPPSLPPPPLSLPPPPAPLPLFFPCCFSDDVAKEPHLFRHTLSQHQNKPNLVQYPFVRFPFHPWHPQQEILSDISKNKLRDNWTPEYVKCVWVTRGFQKRSRRDYWTGTGMWWREMKNTYWGKCWGWINQEKGREDDWKQDGKMRANETWKVLGWEWAKRWTWWCEVGRSSVIPVTHKCLSDHNNYEGWLPGRGLCRTKMLPVVILAKHHSRAPSAVFPTETCDSFSNAPTRMLDSFSNVPIRELLEMS